MKRLLFFLTLCSVFGTQASDKSSEPTFFIINNTDRDVHFTAVGANDVLTIRNLELQSARIITLHPGDEYCERISLHGELEGKAPLLYLYPNPHGDQEVMHIEIDIPRDNIFTVVDDFLGDERIYELGKGKPIYIEIAPGHERHKHGGPRTNYYEGCIVRSIAGDRNGFYRDGEYIAPITKSKDIKRAWNYEALGKWAIASEKNKKEFKHFIETVDVFLYTYLRAGNIVKYLWRYGFKGAKDIAHLRSEKARIEKKIGMKL